MTMAGKTSIEWTDATWNPVTGCTKVSAGCDNCYAERLSERFRGVPGHPFKAGFDLTLHMSRLDQPLRWRNPRRVFVNSMSDLFHKDVPRSFIAGCFLTMEEADWHTYQILTKRSSLMERFVNEHYRSMRDARCSSHIWLGVSVEDEAAKVRIDHLRATRAHVRFLSLEPLVGPLGSLDLTGIHWVIVGGESGPRCRPMHPDWVRDIRDKCLFFGVPFFFKQWGGFRPKAAGRELDGREWSEFPPQGIGRQ